ncbi:MAG TPA: hypothetical protein VEK57_09155 [Thermoanaerobaculia bacterium]|nr:hypothetical protein [Thermoanaerobaculia bacterium]
MSETSRRAFAKSLVAVGAAAPLLIAQTSPAETPKPPSPFAKALTEMTRANYGKHLSAEELERLDKDFQDYAPFVEKFREYKLVNADEPDFTFASLVERW